MHPESRLGRLISFPCDPWGVEKIHIPRLGTEIQHLGVELATLKLRVPGMRYRKLFKRRRFPAGRLKTVPRHDRQPDGKAFEVFDVELLEKSADNTLSVLAHRSGG